MIKKGDLLELRSYGKYLIAASVVKGVKVDPNGRKYLRTAEASPKDLLRARLGASEVYQFYGDSIPRRIYV